MAFGARHACVTPDHPAFGSGRHAQLHGSRPSRTTTAAAIASTSWPTARRRWGDALAQPLVNGPLAALALLGLYLGLITLAQGWDHALEQFDIDLWFVLALAAGFGTQVGLFTYLRALHARMAGGEVGMAASTGTSTAAMLACCAHHVSDVLPILGVSGAAVFLGAYQTPLLWVGIVMNLAGIAYPVATPRTTRRPL